MANPRLYLNYSEIIYAKVSYKHDQAAQKYELFIFFFKYL